MILVITKFLFIQDMAPIQGDPLLSEASSGDDDYYEYNDNDLPSSSVIGIQKTIESAGVAAEQPSLGSEIPSDQQWRVNTPGSSDWT